MQQPGCPNLYWALTDLPCPLVDLRKGVQGDRTVVAAELRAAPRRRPHDGAGDRKVREPPVRRDGLRTRTGGPASPQPAGPAASASQAIRNGSDAARQRLVEAGCSPELVETFPPTQVILLDEKRDYEIERDERMKLLAVPLWQIDSLGRAARMTASDGDGLFADFLPHINKLRQTQARLEQQIALFAARGGTSPLRRGARRQAAHRNCPISPCHCPSTRSPASRSFIRVERSNRPYSRQLGSAGDEQATRKAASTTRCDCRNDQKTSGVTRCVIP